MSARGLAFSARICARLSPSVLRMKTAFWPVVFSYAAFSASHQSTSKLQRTVTSCAAAGAAKDSAAARPITARRTTWLNRTDVIFLPLQARGTHVRSASEQNYAHAGDPTVKNRRSAHARPPASLDHL